MSQDAIEALRAASIGSVRNMMVQRVKDACLGKASPNAEHSEGVRCIQEYAEGFWGALSNDQSVHDACCKVFLGQYGRHLGVEERVVRDEFEHQWGLLHSAVLVSDAVVGFLVNDGEAGSTV